MGDDEANTMTDMRQGSTFRDQSSDRLGQSVKSNSPHKTTRHCGQPPSLQHDVAEHLRGDHRRTSCTLGVGPSPPPGTRLSNKDWANARAAAHASIEPQRNRQPCSALFCRMAGSHRDLAFARCLRKEAASSDHLPATSPAMTTSLARCPGRTSSG